MENSLHWASVVHHWLICSPSWNGNEMLFSCDIAVVCFDSRFWHILRFCMVEQITQLVIVTMFPWTNAEDVVMQQSRLLIIVLLSPLNEPNDKISIEFAFLMWLEIGFLRLIDRNFYVAFFHQSFAVASSREYHIFKM